MVLLPKFHALQSFSEGLAAARLGGYYGYIDSTGSWVIPPQYEYATAFVEDLAIAYNEGKPFTINRTGEKPFVIDNVKEMILLKSGISKILIDTTLNTPIDNQNKITKNTYYIDKQGNQLKLTKAQMAKLRDEPNQKLRYYYDQYVDTQYPKKNQNSYLKTNKERTQYTNPLNRIIWQTMPSFSKLDTLDIDYMYPAEFYAYSDSKATKAPNSEARSDNLPKLMTRTNQFQPKIFSLEIKISDTVHIAQKWLGYKVFIANNSIDTLFFNAIDSRLYMVIQALNKENKWQDMDIIWYSDCGNSYHTLALDPQHFWQFQMPVFKGSMHTRLRLKLKVKGEKDYDVYSNEIKASVNPAQFWRQEAYFPIEILDPSND
jgi:WG containing repeat